MGHQLANILLVGAGSCLGGIARYLVGCGIQKFHPGIFPLGTLLVNIAGCFIIGLIYGCISLGAQVNEELKLFMTVGFCGGFTTFSTFMHENYLLFKSSEQMTLVLYVALSAALGYIAVYFAYYLARAFGE